MSSDWDKAATIKKHEKDFRAEGFLMPDEDWVFNSNWMDYNLCCNGKRAHVTWDAGEVEWFIFMQDSGELIEKDKASCWQEALLAAEKALV